MNSEMYSRIGGKALPEDDMTTVKVINFVDEKGQPVVFGRDPAGPAAQFNKASYVNPSEGTVADLVKALVAAGLMNAS